MIHVDHVTKHYGATVAVDDLSFEVRPGQVTGFLGPNGAGKSTTMRMMVGLDQTAGAIAALVGLLLVVPLVSTFLPSSWNDAVAKYFPARAGAAVFSVVPNPSALAPWTGYAVLIAWTTVAVFAGAVVLRRRDV